MKLQLLSESDRRRRLERAVQLGDPDAVAALQAEQEREAAVKSGAEEEARKSRLRWDTESSENGVTIAQLQGLTCARCGKGFQPQLRPGQTGAPDDRPFINGGIVAFNDDGKIKHYHGYAGCSGCFESAMKELEAGVERQDLRFK